MEKKLKNASSLQLTAAYRDLNKMEQALKMNEEEAVSRRIAAKVCTVSVGQLERAIIAKKEGRIIRVNERPMLLSTSEELALVKVIEEAESIQEHLTLEAVQLKVCIMIFYCCHLKYYISHSFSPLRPRIYLRLFLVKIYLRVCLHSLEAL